MNCVSPIALSNGYVVPCGKCELCKSRRRDEWSVRLQLHADTYHNMPLFLTLTYDDEHLIYSDDGPTLCKSDVRLFLKRYKDRYRLYNTRWSYFGCGEYGDTFGRPHFHLLFFGDNELQSLFDRDSFLADAHVEECWTRYDPETKKYTRIGKVRVFQAQWSGVHYVTKYVLKDDESFGVTHNLRQEPFTIWSHGLGFDWLQSDEAKRFKNMIDRFTAWKREIYESLPLLDFSDPYAMYNSASLICNVLNQYLPNFKVLLPSGEWAYLPRSLRSRLLGKFEHYQDNPFWLSNYFHRLRDTTKYWLDLGCDDHLRPFPIEVQNAYHRSYQIISRLIQNRHKKLKK